MGAVIYKEIRSSFTNMTAAVAVGVVLLVSGVMFWYFNMLNGVLTLSYAYGNTGLVFYIVMPILSMRVFSEERRDRTDQLLFTSGLSIPGIVIGKYLALIIIFAIPVIVMGFYPLIMNSFGAENLAWDYTCLAAFYLEGCAYLAVGMFFSACTENMVIAAILSILFVFITQIGTGILEAAGAGSLRTIFSAVDFASHIEDFTLGTVKLSNVVYFLSVSAAGLLMTHLVIEKRRWS